MASRLMLERVKKWTGLDVSNVYLLDGYWIVNYNSTHGPITQTLSDILKEVHGIEKKNVDDNQF